MKAQVFTNDGTMRPRMWHTVTPDMVTGEWRIDMDTHEIDILIRTKGYIGTFTFWVNEENVRFYETYNHGEQTIKNGE